jgi:LPXTG-site transpeptidase (sortase) family protein
VVQLFSVDAAGNISALPVATTTTANGGYYRFDGLPAGDYRVVLPEDNFTPGGAGSALVGYWSSGTTINTSGVTGEIAAPDADNDLDNDDNGTLQNAGTFNGAVISSVVTLGPGTVEPLNEADLSPTGQGAIDSRANMTVDFGFYRLELGDLVFEDINNNGVFDAGDIPLQNVQVQLFAADGTTEINVGPDGILGTADDAPGGMLTNAAGLYLFGGLPQGGYIVRVTGSIGYTSTLDTFDATDNANPNTNTNNNDNGIGTGAGVVSSAVVTLSPGSAGVQNNNIVTLNTGTTRNPTVDFGFVQANAGIIKSVTPAQATIGQLVTYIVQVQIPPGTFDNAQVVDTMETGLALFDCQSITGVGVTTSLAGGFGCAGNVTTVPGTGVDIDRIVTFNLGNLSNTGQTNGTITVTYRAIVLDIATNRGAATQTVLDNSALFSWNGGTLGPVTRAVTLVEPDLQIVKSSNTNFVALGTNVDFTLTVTHTANSRSDAFDAIITDVLPAELDFVAGSLVCTDGDQDAALVNCAFDAGTRTISAAWSSFTRLPAGDRLIVRFRVTGNALLGPGQTLTNVGNVQWTSELGDQTIPASFSAPPNPFATERFYDPASSNPINTIYGDSDALVLNPVGGGGGGGGAGRSPTAFTSGFLIADTGFEAGTVTPLTGAARPEYASTDLTLSIPSIKVNSSIAGVDLKNGNWDISWLQDQAGWLEGTAYPTWSGNSVLTAHVVNADGKPGLFSQLKYVKVGDYIFVYNSGYRYTFRIVSNEYVQPDDISVLDHQEKPYLTLITCDGFDMKTRTYLRRVVVRAVLVDVSVTK